jgi:26S proteasome regulatory subunit N7
VKRQVKFHFSTFLDCFQRIVLQEKAIEAHEEAFTKTAGKGTKIDLVLTIIRIGFFHSDPSLVSAQIDRAQK